MADTTGPVARQRARLERERAMVLGAYERMSSAVVSEPGEPRRTALQQMMRARYLCPHGCTLLEVFTTPPRLRGALAEHPELVGRRPRHQLSAQAAVIDSDPGRRAQRSRDGAGRDWRPEAQPLAALLHSHGVLGVPLQCDHIRLASVSPDDVWRTALEAEPGRPARVRVEIPAD